jgi:hypothetical protein
MKDERNNFQSEFKERYGGQWECGRGFEFCQTLRESSDFHKSQKSLILQFMSPVCRQRPSSLGAGDGGRESQSEFYFLN